MAGDDGVVRRVVHGIPLTPRHAEPREYRLVYRVARVAQCHAKAGFGAAVAGEEGVVMGAEGGKRRWGERVGVGDGEGGEFVALDGYYAA